MDAEQINIFGGSNVIKHKEKNKIVISASRRTDIPAFYYQWLQDVLKKGEVTLKNPIYYNKTYTVDLKPENIHTIVLWSKDFSNVAQNPGYLENYNLYFEYTINNYSKLLEPNVPSYTHSIRTLKKLLSNYNPRQFLIRFDPIIISKTNGENFPTPYEPEKARLLTFEQLCKDLISIGMKSCRITTSYISFYKHVNRRIEQSKVDIVDLNEEEQIKFFECLAEIAEKYGIELYSCASPLLNKVKGIKKGHCIDGELLVSLFGGSVSQIKDKSQRPECGCCPSKDIGSYDKKCKFNCTYCYVR